MPINSTCSRGKYHQPILPPSPHYHTDFATAERVFMALDVFSLSCQSVKEARESKGFRSARLFEIVKKKRDIHQPVAISITKSVTCGPIISSSGCLFHYSLSVIVLFVHFSTVVVTLTLCLLPYSCVMRVIHLTKDNKVKLSMFD